MAYPGAAASCPAGPNVDFSDILPCKVKLHKKKEKGSGETVIINAVLERLRADDLDTKHALCSLLNYEITVGRQSYPFETEMTFQQACDYYMSFDCFVLFDEDRRIKSGRDEAEGEKKETKRNTIAVAGKDNGTGSDRVFDFSSGVIAAVHIRPNFVGRAGRVANGAFLTVPQARGYGAACVLGSFFPVLAKRCGYLATLFNLVFEANVASLSLWRDKLKYPIVGRVENAGRLVRRDRDGNVIRDETDESGNKVLEMMSAAVMFSVQLDDEHVISVDHKQDNQLCFRREVTLDEIEAAIPSGKFGSFLLQK